ncbi:class I SAM-dependent methyltransferase [Mucilaginibacter segetis]|uniref:Class I SAM-dependent methyltransferase n=1 Tax=Mucilaginibacter segetis TaxID=2793071 RepID=A0A934PU14_9SPHI|nr:class I SAM-dependent methyltransferase [Mucilaginibacter segetis]MBK0379395.1 class I SAM-dependent methyltransferase [Mucilaginibacter segetis]
MAEYQEHNFHSENPSHLWHYIQESLLSLINKEDNRCILDLGCGNGYLVNNLIAYGYNAYGIDASQTGIAIAKQKNPDRFFIQDLDDSKLPVEIRDLKFDTIISTEVIEHLYNPFAFIDFCKSILDETNGELIISTPYHGYFKNLILSVFNKWDKHTNPVAVGGHIKFWSKNTLSKLLTDAGFTIVDFKGCGRFPYLWKSMIIKAKLN